MKLILGVDPGLTRCGFGVISGNTAVDYGHFTSSPTQDPRDRVGSISDSLDKIIAAHKPALIAIERVFAQANLRSVMGVAQMSGALMALAFKHAYRSNSSLRVRSSLLLQATAEPIRHRCQKWLGAR